MTNVQHNETTYAAIAHLEEEAWRTFSEAETAYHVARVLGVDEEAEIQQSNAAMVAELLRVLLDGDGAPEFNPNARRLVCFHNDGRAVVWDVESVVGPNGVGPNHIVPVTLDELNQPW